MLEQDVEKMHGKFYKIEYVWELDSGFAVAHNASLRCIVSCDMLVLRWKKRSLG
jgi:hypothetical protein